MSDLRPPALDAVEADTWPGKFHHRDGALSPVAPGGFYAVDDLASQPGGAVAEGHERAVRGLVGDLESHPGWERLSLLDWSCGALVMVRRRTRAGAGPGPAPTEGSATAPGPPPRRAGPSRG
ncbi:MULTISPECIES: hypothetical protein [unclassified Nocardiopsis]|uniref:hypothetical protein n=1 Tax=unclassified Nocardiopsis TaxID=2649073 RepID=UPI00135993FA|nr:MULTISPECIES: hypothetical protein [unclassified Nocardiopsis]